MYQVIIKSALFPFLYKLDGCSISANNKLVDKFHVFSGATAKLGPRPPHFKIPRSHTTRHKRWAGLPCRYLHTTQTQQAKIHALRSIQILDSCTPAAAKLSRRTSWHRDRPNSSVASFKPHTFSHNAWSLRKSIKLFPHFIQTNERNTTTRWAPFLLTPLPCNTAKLRHSAKAYVSHVLTEIMRIKYLQPNGLNILRGIRSRN